MQEILGTLSRVKADGPRAQAGISVMPIGGASRRNVTTYGSPTTRKVGVSSETDGAALKVAARSTVRRPMGQAFLSPSQV